MAWKKLIAKLFPPVWYKNANIILDKMAWNWDHEPCVCGPLLYGRSELAMPTLWILMSIEVSIDNILQ